MVGAAIWAAHRALAHPKGATAAEFDSDGASSVDERAWPSRARRLRGGLARGFAAVALVVGFAASGAAQTTDAGKTLSQPARSAVSHRLSDLPKRTTPAAARHEGPRVRHAPPSRFGTPSGAEADVASFDAALQTRAVGAAGSSAFYSLVAPRGAARLNVATSGASGNLDLYVKRSLPPARSSFDCRSAHHGDAESCARSSPPPGVYCILLSGRARYTRASVAATER